MPSRRATIAAPPAAVFARVNDLHEFQAWNPFARMDPAAITGSRPNELIRSRLDFVRPFASTAFAEFTFTPEAGRTAVTWSMMGRKNFVSKALIGGQFEQGLATLKSLSEAAAARL